MAHSRASPVPAERVTVSWSGVAPPSRTAAGEARQAVRGGEAVGERASGEFLAEQLLGGRVGEHDGPVGAEKDHGVLETLRAGRTRVPGAPGGGLDALAEALHPLRKASHVVAGAELEAGVAARQALDPPRDAPEVAEQDAARSEPEGDRERQRAGAEREAPQQRLPSVCRTRLVDTPTCTVPNGCSPRRTGSRTS